MQPLVRCAALMSKQYGVITRAQALEAGLTRRQIDHLRGTGMWRNLHRGIYASVDSQAGWHQRAMGACLWAGSGTALSHCSAAYLWRLEGITSPVVEITTQRSIRAAGVLVHRSQDPPKGVVRIAGMPATSLPVTLLNLSAAVPRDRFRGGPGRRLASRAYIDRTPAGPPRCAGSWADRSRLIEECPPWLPDGTLREPARETLSLVASKRRATRA